MQKPPGLRVIQNLLNMGVANAGVVFLARGWCPNLLNAAKDAASYASDPNANSRSLKIFF